MYFTAGVLIGYAIGVLLTAYLFLRDEQEWFKEGEKMTKEEIRACEACPYHKKLELSCVYINTELCRIGRDATKNGEYHGQR